MWILDLFLLAPWLTIYTVSFCRQPPFGPRLLRRTLVLAMCGYGLATLLAEGFQFALKPVRSGQSAFMLARLFMYLGSLSFIVFVRFYMVLRRHEIETPN